MQNDRELTLHVFGMRAPGVAARRREVTRRWRERQRAGEALKSKMERDDGARRRWNMASPWRSSLGLMENARNTDMLAAERSIKERPWSGFQRGSREHFSSIRRPRARRHRQVL
jgi:hypothetical protein